MSPNMLSRATRSFCSMRVCRWPSLQRLLQSTRNCSTADLAASRYRLAANLLDGKGNAVTSAESDISLALSSGAVTVSEMSLGFEAADADSLTESLQNAFAIPYIVRNAEGEQVAAGLVGRAPVEVPVGAYEVTVLTSPSSVVEIEVMEGETAVVVIEQRREVRRGRANGRFFIGQGYKRATKDNSQPVRR